MKSGLRSSLSEGSLGPGLRLLPTLLAGLLKLLAAPGALPVPGQCLPPSLVLPEISFLPGKSWDLPRPLVLQVTGTCTEHLTWEEDKKKRRS